jgi:tetratricopeptide (TPR) repeat protein
LLLKERGDKHFLLEVAYLSLSAAKRVRGDRNTAVARVRCEICGIAWVYQRVGQLAKAQAAAAVARELAETIGSDANVAYAEKCSGRLARVQAEGLSGHERFDKLAASTGHLHRAIDAFEADHDYGPRHPEVGDCYSLLARTHLVAKDLSACESAITSGFEILSASDGKDYIDALILRAELFETRSRFDDARLRLDDAVSLTAGGGREMSEARARALLARGRLIRRSGGDARDAVDDFRAADEIWTKLDEPELAAGAR